MAKLQIPEGNVKVAVQDISRKVNEMLEGGTANTYTVTNGTTDRTYDADATSVTELADVLATLISDLKSKGILV